MSVYHCPLCQQLWNEGELAQKVGDQKSICAGVGCRGVAKKVSDLSRDDFLGAKVIETYFDSTEAQSKRWRARLQASPEICQAAGSKSVAIRNLLTALSKLGKSGDWDHYTVVDRPDWVDKPS